VRTIALLMLSGAAGALAGEAVPAPNLLVIYVDDLNMDVHRSVVSTPNIDALAARGVTFNRAYAAHTVCTPSRTAFLSGQRTHHTQVVSNGYPYPQQALNGVPYLPCALRTAGYHTAGLGKIFHSDPAGCWDEDYAYIDDPWIEQPTIPHTPESFGTVFGGPFLNGPDGSLGKMAETKHVDKALDILLQRQLDYAATGQPFALWLGFESTHNPFVYPESFDALYTPADVPALPPGETGLPWKSGVSKPAFVTKDFYDPEWGATEDERREEAVMSYYRCISFIDQEVGRVLQALQTLGLEEDTVVVFVSDHGYSFGEHDHIGKTTGFDEDALAPLIIAAPQLPATHGLAVETPVEQIDVYPTLTELFALAQPALLDGSSLVPSLLDVRAPAEPAFFTTSESFAFNLTRYVVAEDPLTGEIWKLGAWEKDDNTPQINQLYNLSADPGEYVNLYTDPAHATKVAELRQQLLDVGLLGPGQRNFGVGRSGTLGVPALTFSGAPLLGGTGTLVLGNAAGQDSLALLCIGFDGLDATQAGFTVKQQILLTLVVPEDGLSLQADLPPYPIFHELPVGLQLVHVDSGAEGNVAYSRGLALLLSL
jgi:uncharacterized sulfatase